MNLICTAAVSVVLVAFSTASRSADAVTDRAADAEKGKALVAELCVQCHSGRWEDETYESLTVLLKNVQSGKFKHRFGVRRLTDEEIKQVAAYWSSRAKSTKNEKSSSK